MQQTQNLEPLRDELVSFETAKLLKEKGFNWTTDYAYWLNIEQKYYLNHDPGYFTKDFLKDSPHYAVPYLFTACSWLREIQNKLVVIYSNASGYCWEIMDAIGGTHRSDYNYTGPNESGCWDTYESALEAGIQEALK